MTTGRGQLDYRHFSAPRENGTALVDPPPGEVGRMLAENARLAAQSDYDVQGRSLAELSRQARAELLADARRWTAAYRRTELASEDPGGPIFLAGHQPELFHPGVWFKNFALGALARQHGAAAVNLIIDSDTIKTASLRTPGGSATDPGVEAIPLDRPEPPVPYEERRIVDGAMLADFGRRVAAKIAPLVPDPLVRSYWPMVCERARHTDRLGYCLAQARHQLEGQWGLQTLEIPQSWVCRSDSFCWFSAHLLAQLPRFREIHNEALHEYRRANRLRSAAHPAPDLGVDGPWVEAPFWIWTAGQPQRRRLFARREGRQTVVSDRGGLELRLPLEPEGDAAAAVEEMVRWNRQDIKIRSRALITTLWARLVLGDLFLHGIGGANYDQVTDRLIERFFRIRAPGIMVLSATLHLPVDSPHAVIQQARAVRQELRELEFHPERFLQPAETGSAETGTSLRSEPVPLNEMPQELSDLIAAKQRWIATSQTPENAHSRWRALQEINAAMQPWVEDRRRRLMEMQKQAARALRAEKVLCSREYGFCLYPEKILREFLDALLPKNG